MAPPLAVQVLPALRRFVEAALASGFLGGGAGGGAGRGAGGGAGGGAGDAAEMAHEAHAFMHAAARTGDAPRAVRLTVPPSVFLTGGERGRAPSGRDIAGSIGGRTAALMSVAALSAGSTSGAERAPAMAETYMAETSMAEALLPRSRFRAEPTGASSTCTCSVLAEGSTLESAAVRTRDGRTRAGDAEWRAYFGRRVGPLTKP